MAWTADELAAAKAALLSAVTSGKSVTFGGRSWTSHDLSELRELIAEMERSSSINTQTYRLAAHSKGLD